MPRFDVTYGTYKKTHGKRVIANNVKEAYNIVDRYLAKTNKESDESLRDRIVQQIYNEDRENVFDYLGNMTKYRNWNDA